MPEIAPCRVASKPSTRRARIRWRRHDVRMLHRRRWQRHRFIVRETCGPATVSTARRSLPRPTPRPWSSPAGSARGRPSSTIWCCARVAPRAAARAIGTTVDPVMLEVFNNLFMSIAEQMGLRLQNTAYSVNIKERLDFSCALFDAEGNLIANAPHMPVHLGSMSESIKTVMRENAGAMVAGDAYVINDPYHGGTHLPDVTVITPVFDRAAARSCFTSARAATTPISAASRRARCRRSRRTLDEEGVRFINFRLVEGRAGQRGTLPRSRAAARARARASIRRAIPQQNVADLRAQVAANEKGARGTAEDGRALRPGRRASVHAARAGQRRGIGAARDHAADGRRVRISRSTTAP